MLIHDIIKIKYVSLGYITKNYPYHLISDEEMFSAFIDIGYSSNIVDPNTHFFDTYYPNPFTLPGQGEYSLVYENLRKNIISTIITYLSDKQKSNSSEVKLPDWIYTYMLGEVIYKDSEYLDIYDLLKLLHCNNIDNEFTPEACIACYNNSLKYVSTLTVGRRPPTVFGEPHVIKQLRLGV